MNESPMIFDTHCHYNLEPLADNWSQHWQTAQAHGVHQSVVVGTSVATSRLGTDVAKAEPNLYVSLGIHPHVFQDSVLTDQPVSADQLQTWLIELKDLVTQKTVAIGEVGLDYFHLPEDTAQKQAIIQLQEQGFIAQIQLANELKLPLIIHVRDQAETAYERVLSLLQQEYQFARPFILHCVSGPTTYIQAAIKLGAYIGVAGNVTYKNAHHIRELVALTPKDCLLLETDAPFLPPQAHRGQTCEPWMIKETAEFLETQLQISTEQLTHNAYQVFQLS